MRIPRTATVRAITPAVVASCDSDDLRRVPPPALRGRRVTRPAACAGLTPLARARTREHGVAEPRPGVDRPLAEVDVGERGARETRLGVDPEERRAARLRAEVAERARQSSTSRSSAATSRPSTRSRGPSRSDPAGRSLAGRRAGRGTARCVASASVSRATSVGASSSRPNTSRSASVPTRPEPASPRSSALRASGRSTASRRYSRERHLRLRLERGREDVEALVRVDARASGCRENLPVRAEPGRRGRAGDGSSRPPARPGRRARAPPPRPRSASRRR